MSDSIAIIEDPKSCENCIFRVTKYWHPFWSKDNKNSKGYYCQLDAEHKVAHLHIDDNDFKFPDCPLIDLEKAGELIAESPKMKTIVNTIKAEVLLAVDNSLHELAMEYANAGHKDYFGVCENIHWKVVRKIAKEIGAEVE